MRMIRRRLCRRTYSRISVWGVHRGALKRDYSHFLLIVAAAECCRVKRRAFLGDGPAAGLVLVVSFNRSICCWVYPSAYVRFVIDDAVEHTVGAVFGIIMGFKSWGSSRVHGWTPRGYRGRIFSFSCYRKNKNKYA